MKNEAPSAGSPSVGGRELVNPPHQAALLQDPQSTDWDLPTRPYTWAMKRHPVSLLARPLLRQVVMF